MDAAPDVSTDPATDITDTSFTANMTVSGGGNVTTVTERGFAWIQGSSGTPEVEDNVEFETGDFGNDFSWGTTINSLEPETDYRVRAYAVNSVGTTYGDTITVTTTEAILDTIFLAGRSPTGSRSTLVVGDTSISLSGRSSTSSRASTDVRIVAPEQVAGRSSTGSRAVVTIGFGDFNPLNLAVVIDGSTAHLTWDPSPGDVIDYQVFRRTPQTGEPFDPVSDEPVAAGVPAVAEPSYDDTELDAADYDWQVFGRVRG